VYKLETLKDGINRRLIEVKNIWNNSAYIIGFNKHADLLISFILAFFLSSFILASVTRVWEFLYFPAVYSIIILLVLSWKMHDLGVVIRKLFFISFVIVFINSLFDYILGGVFSILVYDTQDIILGGTSAVFFLSSLIFYTLGGYITLRIYSFFKYNPSGLFLGAFLSTIIGILFILLAGMGHFWHFENIITLYEDSLPIYLPIAYFGVFVSLSYFYHNRWIRAGFFIFLVYAFLCSLGILLTSIF